MQPRVRFLGSARWLSLLSLLIILAISAGCALLLSQFLRDNLLARDAVVTQELVQSIAYTQNAAAYFAERDSGQSKAVLDAFFRQIVSLPDVMRVNVFATDGTILWSSGEQLVGQRFTDNDELMRALGGDLVIETGQLEAAQKAEHVPFEWPFDQWFVESYIPVRDRGVVVGVVELYKVPRALSETIAKSALIAWASILLGGVLFYAVVLWLTANRPAAAAPDHPSAGADTVEIDLGKPRERVSYRQQPPARWAPALVVLAAALLGPVILGASVLYIYGVADDAPLSGVVQARQSPLAFVASAAATLITGTPAEETALTSVAPIAERKIQQPQRQIPSEIDVLLDKAWRAFAQDALTTPVADNAVKWAEAALRLDPDNADAGQVLSAVIDAYLDWAMQAYDRGKLSLASTYLHRAQSLYGYAAPEQLAAFAALSTRQGDLESLAAKLRQRLANQLPPA